MRSLSLNTALKGLIAILLVVLGWTIVRSLHENVVDAGDTAPAFTVTTDRGSRISPEAFGGRVLVLNFWATWCAPCVDEAPSLNAFQNALRDSGVVVLGVSIDRNEKAYRNFLKRFNIHFETARDPNADVSYRYGTFKIPETYIIDRTGKVVQKIIGPRNWTDPDFVNSIKQYL